MAQRTASQRLTQIGSCALGIAVSLVLAACSIGGSSNNINPSLTTTNSTPASAPSQAPGQARLRAKIALLLPLSGNAQTAAIAKGMKQAAEMALFDLNDPGFQLVVKDTQGTPEGAVAAATRAASDGAELIVGPLFAKSVTAVANVARQARLPVVAFSNDQRVAGNGVYLLSFSATQEIDRIVSYAAAQGKRRFAALLPEGDYGKLAEAAFSAAAARNGGGIIAVERYPANSNGMLEPSKRLFDVVKASADAGAPVDAIFMPGGPETLPNLGPLVSYANLGGGAVKFLGSGGWDFPNLGRNKNFVGSWFPAPDPRGWRAFSEKFSRTFGSAPPRIATLAHDGVSMAIQLAQTNPAGQRYVPQKITRTVGFTGIDGPFRFDTTGIAVHSLAVHEVQKFGSAVIDPARPAAGAGVVPNLALRAAQQ